MCHKDVPAIFNREITLEEKENRERRVILVYNDIEAFFKIDEYNQGLRSELKKSNPNYLDVLKKWRNDLENSEHGIVIAGILSDLNISVIGIQFRLC